MDMGNINFKKYSSNTTLELMNDSLEKEKVKQTDLKKPSAKESLDSFENSGEITDIMYEVYPNYQSKKPMPKSVFGDQFGYDMQKEIADSMEDFYAGKITQGELEDFFEQCCTSMRKYRAALCQTSGDDALDKKQIVSKVYEIFAKENARSARSANYEEGEALNAQYGGRKDDWVYYNSDYYYQCEDTKKILQGAIKDVTDKWEMDAVDTEEIEKNSTFTLDGGFDFNSVWNFTFRNQVGRASLEDESMIPPENFKFFYKEKSVKEGDVWISLNERQIDEKVPFSISQTGSLKGQIFYVYDLIDELFQGEYDKESYKGFLNNLSIFTRWYSYESGINNVFGDFVSQKS